MKYQLPEAAAHGLTCAERRMIAGKAFVCLCDHRAARGVLAGRHYMVEQSRVEG